MVARVFCHDYPNNPYIDALYSIGNVHSRYKVIALGYYPQNIKYTQKSSRSIVQYQIPDGYIIETEAANKAIRCETKYIPRISRENSRLSGIHVFGLDIEILHQARTEELTIAKTTNIDKRKRPLSEVSVSQQNKRYASFGRDAHKKIKQLILQHRMISESGEPIHLRNMELEYEDHIINIKYNLLLDHIKLDAYVRACDEALLGRDGYRRLAAVEARLTREYQVAQRRIEITKLINEQIPIGTINLNKEVNQLDDDDEHQSNPDGIMVDEQEIGKEKYETLAKVGNLFKYQLQDLQENGISVDGVHWPIELYFSGDWKFMYNIMGLNAPNARYFCLYCDCEASNRWNVDLCWPINKNTKCQKKPPLFPAIKQENYIPDELHLLLRISDVLMECFFNDLFKKREFEREIKNQIEQTMKSIKVHFEFFKSRSNSGKWDWTSLMGPDKKKVLQHFPIVNFISGKRGEEIQKLWRDFYDLYLVLRSPNLTYSEIDNFENKAKQWIKLFCRPSQGQMNSASQIPGLYRKEDVTPYMHVFSQHIPEFLRNLKEKNMELRVFSTSSIEKKNHNQVRLFFCGTTMGGGTRGKPVVYDIMEFENRQLYYLINNTPQEILMRHIDAGDKENKD
ncbi:hypothetical protein GLOIN_2v1828103 [Rhizophagus irregularis DAOM 181602=DAOM 197198]|nr:hypothetical protein GLOIN_2v1828103 [Rhizophagus irregularis DAOM 181602=DAOM 197198]